MSEKKGEFAMGWKVLLAGLVGVACGASPLPFNTIGFVLAPMKAEFGWSYAQTSLGVTIYGVIGALLAPYFGSLADKHGVRKVAMLSTLAFGLIFACIGAIPASIFAFYIMWFLVGLVGIGSTPVTWSRAVNMWFFKNRGLALGILLVGTSISALVVPRVAVWAIGEWGWRGMYPAVALFPLLVALPIAYFWFREPRPEETPEEITSGGGLVGVSLAEALRDRRFWTIWLSIALVALAYGGAHIHMPEIIKQHGMGVTEGASIMGMIGFALMAGRVITGWLLDRIWAPFVCLPILLIPALACYWLMGTSSEPRRYTLPRSCWALQLERRATSLPISPAAISAWRTTARSMVCFTCPSASPRRSRRCSMAGCAMLLAVMTRCCSRRCSCLPPGRCC